MSPHLTRRQLGTIVMGGLGAGVVASCSTSPAADKNTTVNSLSPSATVSAEIAWWHGQSADAAQLLSALAREYERSHPRITIKEAAGASTTDDLLQKLQAGFASDTYPDICYAYGSWVTTLGLSGRTLDISSLVATTGSGWEEFPEGARATATVNDEVVGFPAVIGDLALYYNKDLFDAAGIAVPDESWTWDDFRSAAQAITDPSRNIYGTAYPVPGNEDTTWRFWPQLWQNGGQILDEEGMPAFNSQAGVDALEFWRGLAVDNEAVYLDQNGEKYAPSFQSGNIGMIISGPWYLYDFTRAKTPYGVSVLPGTNGDHQTIAGVDVWTLFDQGDEARASAAYDFTRWLTAPEQDVRWNVAYGNLPLRASAADTPEFEKYVRDFPGADVFFANLQNAVNPRPTVKGYEKMSGFVGKAISRVLQGQGDAQSALDDAAAQSAPALK